MRRRTVLERIQQESELAPRLLDVDAEQVEDGGLQVLTVDAHGSATDLRTVQHHVVGLGDRAARIGAQRVGVQVLGRGERMVHRRPTLVVGVVLEHGEVDDPQRRPVTAHEPQVLAQLQAQRTERVVDDFGGVRTEEDQIVGGGLRTREDPGHRGIGEEFDDRRLQTVTALRGIVDLDVGESTRAVACDERGVIVDLLAGELAAARDAQRRHAPRRVARRA